MPSLEEAFGRMLAPGKLKKHPGAGPLGHKDGLITELELEYILLVVEK